MRSLLDLDQNMRKVSKKKDYFRALQREYKKESEYFLNADITFLVLRFMQF